MVGPWLNLYNKKYTVRGIQCVSFEGFEYSIPTSGAEGERGLPSTVACRGQRKETLCCRKEGVGVEIKAPCVALYIYTLGSSQWAGQGMGRVPNFRFQL